MDETFAAERLKQPPAAGAAALELFTAIELAAAAQLVQLSESSGDTSAFPSPEAEEDRNSSSSPRSVGTRPPPPESVLLENEEEETGPRRSAQRYRPIAEVYAAVVHGSSKKRKRRR